jgi:tetratricopeptide (TPR) repeat protein
MKSRQARATAGTSSSPRQVTSYWTAGLLLAVFPGTILAQTAGSLPQNQPIPTQTAPAGLPTKASQPHPSDRRRAAKLYLASSKLFVGEQFEEAMRGYKQAASLDPSNSNYSLAAQVACSHAVTALIQAAAKDRLRGDQAAARGALAHALELDPTDPQIAEHLQELGDDALLEKTNPLYAHAASTIGEAVQFAPPSGVHSFHLHTGQRQAIQQVFKAYGIESTLDESVHSTPIRLDMDDASFEQTMHTLSLLTHTFYVQLDAHRVIVAQDTPQNRQQFVPQELETIYLSGLTSAELTEVSNLAKNVFDAQQAVVEPTAGTMTIRAPENTLNAFNTTMRELLDGHNQVILEARLIQLAHTGEHNTGAQLPQTVTAFNVYGEAESILSENSALVQEIISSGLAASGDTLAILGILLASGEVSSSLFSNGIATFGGGITESALSPGTVSVNLSLNSSESRELDQIQLRLGDGEAGTIRSGMRYPITTSSYSSLTASSSSTAGLSTAGTSSSLLSSLTSGSTTSTVPMVEYQDLGLTLKATPNVMRNNEVALTLDMKIDTLAGTALNDIPILNSRTYSGVVTLKQDEGVVILNNLSKQESRTISGTPGISEIPGLNDVTGKDKQMDYSTLLIVITPHVIRGTQSAGHSSRIRIERSTPAK